MRFDGFYKMLEYHASLRPDAAALLYESDGKKVSVSYSTLLASVSRRARELKQHGKTALGIICDGTIESVTEIFASVEAGMQTVMLDDSVTPEILRLTDVDMLWGDDEIKDEMAPYLSDGLPSPGSGKGKILFFTSGTTSKNKAVELTEKSLCSSAYNGSALLPLSEDDILMCMLPLAHVFGFVCGLLWGLSSGACVALGRGARHYFDDLSFFRPTALSAVPLLAGFLIQRKLFNPELKLVLIGAGECPETIPSYLKQAGIRLSFGYGLTETSSGVALSLGDDPYSMTVCPDDEISIADDGEILIKAPTCMMQGYYKDPGSTEKVLRGGILHTGDLGEIDREGRLRVTGRKKEILVLGDGTKIFIPEYESSLGSALAGYDYAVISDGGFPCLVVSGDEQKKEIISDLLSPVMKGYPYGKQIKKYFFIDRPIPRTQTGKVKRWEIYDIIKNQKNI